MWVLIVEPNSRGNAVGDELRASQAIDAQVVADDEALLTRGQQVKEHGELCAEVAAAELLEATEQVTDAVEVSHRAVQIAASALGVRDIPSIRWENLMKPTMPHIDRIREKVRLELATQQQLATQLGILHLPALEALPSPHAPLVTPAGLMPSTEYIDPRGMPNFAGSTLMTPDIAESSDESTSRRSRLLTMSLALAAAAATAIMAWLLIGHDAFSAADPASLEHSTTWSPPVANRTTEPLLEVEPLIEVGPK
jgi:hypothetical protein